MCRELAQLELDVLVHEMSQTCGYFKYTGKIPLVFFYSAVHYSAET